MGRMSLVCVLLIGFVFIFVACTEESSSSGGVSRPTAVSRPGDSVIYTKIESLTSCGELQREFDLYMDGHDRARAGTDMREVLLSYAKAANQRLQDVGC